MMFGLFTTHLRACNASIYNFLAALLSVRKSTWQKVDSRFLSQLYQQSYYFKLAAFNLVLKLLYKGLNLKLKFYEDVNYKIG